MPLRLLAALLLIAPCAAAEYQKQDKPASSAVGQAGSAGKYVLVRTASQASQPVCAAYARNLNEFRQIEFDACESRLSPKYPRFVRPDWQEIPFEASIAERMIKGDIRTLVAPKKAEAGWETWLARTEKSRSEGKVRMWGTRIDLDGKGQLRTIVRMHDELLSLLGKSSLAASTEITISTSQTQMTRGPRISTKGVPSVTCYVTSKPAVFSESNGR
jgi:hypothetical protein